MYGKNLLSLLKALSQLRTRLPSAVFRRSPLALKLLRWLLSGRRKIVVIGGHNGEGFDDNSRAMAVHLAADPSYRVYWVRGRRHRRDVGKYQISQLRKGSFRAELVAAAAHCIFFSHGLTDVTQAPVSKTPWRTIIYLGHGVWGFKRIERRSRSERRKSFDVTVCASPTEKTLKAAVLQISSKAVLSVGIPKHDALLNGAARRYRHPDRKKTVLYAPTWRDWLQYRPSDIALERHFRALEAIAKSMPKCDSGGAKLTLVYLVHKNVRGIADQARKIAKKHKVRIAVTKDVDVNKLISDADYLITDYSGLFWDFVVQRKAAARYLFDKDVYDALTGSYPDVENLTGGVSFVDPHDVWNFLLGNEAIEEAARLTDEVLPFSDGRACERLAVAMDNLIDGKLAHKDFHRAAMNNDASPNQSDAGRTHGIEG